MITTDEAEKKLDRYLLKLSILGLMLYILTTFIIQPTIVKGDSMLPTLKDKDYVLLDMLTPSINGYDRFDVIVFEQQEGINYIKRIIGVEGDEVEYANDKLYVNGIEYEEPYLDKYKEQLMPEEHLTEDFTLKGYLGKKVVPKGTVFVLGDNRRKSLDSRQPAIGFIDIDDILGETKILYRNLDGMKLINN